MSHAFRQTQREDSCEGLVLVRFEVLGAVLLKFRTSGILHCVAG